MPMINIAKSYLDTNGTEGTSDLLYERSELATVILKAHFTLSNTLLR